MPRALVLGNGNILVGIDQLARVRDIYFPYVGLENHLVGKYAHRIGVWEKGLGLSWLDDGRWEISIDMEAETLVGRIKADSAAMDICLNISDIVYNEKNIFLRRLRVKNLSERERTIKVFFHHEFEIYESHRGDTAFYDPYRKVIIHYKGRRVFVINAHSRKDSFDDYSIGIFGTEGKEGTYKDAEDGILSKNPIEHGRTDSVIGLTLSIPSKEEEYIWYWIAIAESFKEAYQLNEYAITKTPAHLFKTTKDFWHAWVNKQNFTFYGLDEKVVDLFKKSLLIMRTHIDNNGSVLASGDSDLLQYGRDTYGYMWPRDGAISASALINAGDTVLAKKFFQFCSDVITKDGYFLHKYRADKSLGSSWHPWVYEGKPTLPIQEDETALVLIALWEYYTVSKDLEFVEQLYNPVIKSAADFMAQYIEPSIGLPKPSYDLWEEKYGISTFTAATVYSALRSAANFAQLLGKTQSVQYYQNIAERIKDSVVKLLYNSQEEIFYKLLRIEEGRIVYDSTIDMSSVYGVYGFGLLPPDDELVKKSIKTIEQKLCCKTSVGGVPRYVGDNYYRMSKDVPGNPWFITTLWLAKYYIMTAKSESDLKPVKDWLSWVVRYAVPSGILSEQIDPHTGKQISSAPLTWSHSEFVLTVISYLQKLEELGICKACNPLG